MTPLGILRTFIKGLTQNTTPRQLAGGAALGVLLGLVPKANLTAQLLLVLLMAFRVNIPLGLGVAAVVSLLGFVFDPVSGYLGYAVLTASPLEKIWTYLYNAPILPWTAFNNTLVAGGVLLGLVLFAPVFLLTANIAEKHGAAIKTAVTESKLAKAVRRSWLVEWYFRMGN